MNNRFAALAASLLMANCLLAQSWPEPAPEAKPGARWWWMGSAVNQADLKWNMQEYAKTLNSDVNDFCNSFDYRNAGKLHSAEMEHVRTSIERAVAFLTSRKPDSK